MYWLWRESGIAVCAVWVYRRKESKAGLKRREVVMRRGRRNQKKLTKYPESTFLVRDGDYLYYLWGGKTKTAAQEKKKCFLSKVKHNSAESSEEKDSEEGNEEIERGGRRRLRRFAAAGRGA